MQLAHHGQWRTAHAANIQYKHIDLHLAEQRPYLVKLLGYPDNRNIIGGS
jgi:hypothetical protein